jgi:hypothetical protein
MQQFTAAAGRVGEVLNLVSNLLFLRFSHCFRFVSVDEHTLIGPPATFNGLGSNTNTMDSADEEAKKIIEDSIEMGDRGPVESIEGDCTVCGDDATWQDPISGDLYCEEHATEHFEGRHS